jgi:hypothetical protein
MTSKSVPQPASAPVAPGSVPMAPQSAVKPPSRPGRLRRAIARAAAASRAAHSASVPF